MERTLQKRPQDDQTACRRRERHEEAFIGRAGNVVKSVRPDAHAATAAVAASGDSSYASTVSSVSRTWSAQEKSVGPVSNRHRFIRAAYSSDKPWPLIAKGPHQP